jgi:hypothetical protein
VVVAHDFIVLLAAFSRQDAKARNGELKFTAAR